MFSCDKCHHSKEVSDNGYDSDFICTKHDYYVDKGDDCMEECRNAIENYRKERRIK